MNTTSSLEELISTYVALGPRNGKGWRACVHLGCDHGRKGPRSAFIFEGESMGFNCYNCGVATTYNPDKIKYMPPKMKQVLADFGIPDQEWQKIVLENMGKFGVGVGNQPKADEESIDPAYISMPDTFYELTEENTKTGWGAVALDYITNDRMMKLSDHQFMMSKFTDDYAKKKWLGRLILPMFRHGKLIYYQGRDLTGNAVKKYESPPESKDKVIGNVDELFTNDTRPLYIVEGWFDAKLIGGCAILGNKITTAQIAQLNRSRREKVFIPDMTGNGRRAAEQALDEGWKVSVPDIPECSDITDAFTKYGKLYTMASIKKHTVDGFNAKLRLSMLVDTRKG